MVKISVVIPVYNDEKYIVASITSVLNQTYGDIEIIVVDDGSIDNSVALIEAIGVPLNIIRTKNGGPAKARNLGMEAATGEYIAFLDADDLWMPEKLAKQMNQMRDGISLVYSARKWIDTDGVALVDQPSQKEYPSGDVFRKLVDANFIVTSSVLMRTVVFSDIGGFDESDTFANCQDYQYWFRISSKYAIAVVAENLIQYRVHESNRHKNFERRLRGMIGCMDTAEAIKPELSTAISVRKFFLYSSYGRTFFFQGEYLLSRSSFSSARSLGALTLSDRTRYLLSFLPAIILSTIKNLRK